MIFQSTGSTVAFWHGSNQLAGDLVIPAGPSPHPAVALVGGTSGPRENGPWVAELANSGVMTLSWDSPGWGDSPGEQLWQTPDQRAPELLDAVEYLAATADVPAGGVGVVAADLGAWSGIMAATLSSRIEALVLLSPPLTGVMEQEVELFGRRLQALGFIRAEIQLAQAVLHERIRRLRAGQSGRTVLAAEAACQQAPWYGWLPGTTPEEIEAFGQLAGYDARTMLPMVRCPVLAVFVERPVPDTVWRDAELARRILDSRTSPDHRVLVLPSAGSDQVITWEVAAAGPRILHQGSFDLIGMITTWLTERVNRTGWRRAG